MENARTTPEIFHARPEVVEAWQVPYSVEGPEAAAFIAWSACYPHGDGFIVDTLNGVAMWTQAGDREWVVKGGNGQLRILTDADFRAVFTR